MIEVAEALIEAQVLTEVVGAQDNVEFAGIHCVAEAIGQMTSVALHPGETNLSLFLDRVDELVPFWILQTCDLVDRGLGVRRHDRFEAGADWRWTNMRNHGGRE
jgi:hypothetical protein